MHKITRCITLRKADVARGHVNHTHVTDDKSTGIAPIYAKSTSVYYYKVTNTNNAF